MTTQPDNDDMMDKVIEEAAREHAEGNIAEPYSKTKQGEYCRHDFIEGAKWALEYVKKDVSTLICIACLQEVNNGFTAFPHDCEKKEQ